MMCLFNFLIKKSFKVQKIILKISVVFKNYLYSLIVIFILEGRETDSPVAGLLPKCLDQVRIRSPELYPGLPCDWQEPKHLSHYLLSLRISTGRMLDWKHLWYGMWMSQQAIYVAVLNAHIISNLFFFFFCGLCFCVIFKNSLPNCRLQRFSHFILTGLYFSSYIWSMIDY